MRTWVLVGLIALMAVLAAMLVMSRALDFWIHDAVAD